MLLPTPLRWPTLRRSGALILLTIASLGAAVAPRAASAQSPAALDAQGRRHLVSVAWLQQNLARPDLRLLDASSTQIFNTRHIAGAVSADIYSYAGVINPTAAAMQQRLRSWGLHAEHTVVMYDPGGAQLAPRLFFDLVNAGFPAERLFILDGGLAKWQADGGAVTKEPTPAPTTGTFELRQFDDRVRVRLPEFLLGSGDPARHALIEALEPQYYFGGTKFFDRGGHVPNATMMPSDDFYNADKTFKSASEITRMLRYLGVRPEQQLYTYCGGGIAAAVPFFAAKYVAGYPDVKLYKESQLEWLRDERGLPVWNYAAPQLKRDMLWLNGWGSQMMRVFGYAQISVVDVRPPEAYALGHVPFALNVPAETFRRHLGQPEALAALLGPAGIDAAHEAVVVGERGVTPRAALAFLLLERAGQKQVSILIDSVDEWGLKGLPLAKDPTVVGPPRSPKDQAVPAAVYRPVARPAMAVAGDAEGFTKVTLAVGAAAPAAAAGSRVVHVPYAELLTADGLPKPAHELWVRLSKAGLPRYAEVTVQADDPGEAAVGYFVLRLMGWPRVQVAGV